MAQKKKVQPEESPAVIASANWNFVLKWIFILGGVATGVVNALANNTEFTVPDGLLWVFVTIGILVGVFYFSSDDLINIGLRFMIFSAAARSLPGNSELVSYLSAFFIGFSLYLGPIVLTITVVYFVKKYLLSKE